ncbi:HNH endonuclease [uncultured Spongiibacter sp.]|uniref:HNH endonuclease n=1 Tax=uncultured Spongiibacter sp. TaxID=870896 RepID=UPI002594DE17|nr:HNH endonuclease [uncultured Spongiibacter sp.]
MKREYAVLAVLLIPILVVAHPGGVDSFGGHKNKSTGEYHCHRDTCRAAQNQVQSATQDAEKEGRSFSQLYDRKDYPHWSDLDGDCMNTRHEILAASSVGNTRISPNGCYVSSGQWNDPFSGKVYTRASDLDVDHIVPLKWAHTHGAAEWPRNLKEKFANDPENLIAVDDALNQAKGARGPTEWMPPNHSYRCEYLSRWVLVLKKYSLAMQPSENRVFQKQLSACSLSS